MHGLHVSLPLTQRQWHEQAAHLQGPPPPPPAQSSSNPFTRNPSLIQEEQ